MAVELTDKLVVAITSRTLFDMHKSNELYEDKGVEEYAEHQIKYEDKILRPGAAFPLVKKLLKLNESEPLVEVILLSRNSADTGLRIFNSIQHYDLNISRAAFTSGESPYRYIQAFGSHLFLSANAADVKVALNAGCAAATLIDSSSEAAINPEIRIAFDGDSVLFSDVAERVFQQSGLEAFTHSEQQAAEQPLPGGPFKGFLSALHKLQSHFSQDDCPIRTALVTARQAPAHERVIRTLRSWNIRIDEALFLGGLAKGEFLQAFGADIFFDDQQDHCESATDNHITAGHVPHGIKNTTD
ncbi:MAG: 5'-nucleotidase [Coxiellaceae bacterium]|nr:5'-nucleotidase [Coxiellaceae bacterium]